MTAGGCPKSTLAPAAATRKINGQSRCRAGLFAAATILFGLGGCCPGPDGPADSFGIDFSLPPGSRTDGAIIFLVDGINTEVFRSMLDAGELPAFQKYFIDRGYYVPRVSAGNPSITMSCLTSIVTGRLSGHHGLVAPKWFDRNRLIFRNYETLVHKNMLDLEYQAPTLYEQFPDRLTFSSFYQPHRGATWFFENRWSAGPAFIMEMFETVDRIALWRLNEAMKIARRYREFPAITTVYMLAPNFRAYKSGVFSPEYRRSLAHSDRQIGRVLGDLDRAGLLDKVVVALVSDHGHCDSPNHPNAEDHFRNRLGLQLGYATPSNDGEPFDSRLRRFEQVSAIPYGGGDRYWALYLRKPVRTERAAVSGSPSPGLSSFEPWTCRPDPYDLRHYPTATGAQIDLVAELCRQEYVDAVAHPAGPDRVRVIRAAGEVEFTRHAVGDPTAPDARLRETISYRLVAGTDPLGWAGQAPPEALAGRPLTSRQWLEATAEAEFPDLPVGLMAYFDGVWAADLVAFPAPTWDFDGWRKAGHGGIRAAEMWAPMALAGPGVPKETGTVARTVDVMPTLLQLLGKPIPPGLDGQPLFGSADPNATATLTIPRASGE